MSSYQYRKSHCGDKTVLSPQCDILYWYDGIFILNQPRGFSTSLLPCGELYWMITVYGPSQQLWTCVSKAGLCFNIKTVFPVKGIPVIKMTLSWDRLVFIIGISMLVRWHLDIETAPGIKTWLSNYISQHSVGCNYLPMPKIPAFVFNWFLRCGKTRYDQWQYTWKQMSWNLLAPVHLQTQYLFDLISRFKPRNIQTFRLSIWV